MNTFRDERDSWLRVWKMDWNVEKRYKIMQNRKFLFKMFVTYLLGELLIRIKNMFEAKLLSIKKH